MKSKIALAVASVGVLACAAVAGSAVAQPPAEKPTAHRQCFWTRDVDNFAAVDQHTVNVRVGVKDVYQFEMMGPCPDIDWNQRIALVSRGSAMICSGIDAEVVTHSPIGPMRCPVKNIRKLTPAEVAALPPRARP